MYQHTDKSKRRVSEQFKGVVLSKEHKRKISETKKKVYHPYRGKKLSEEHKEKNRQSQIGRKHTKETRMKISNNMIGEKNPNYGKKFSKEYREKLSAARKGRKHSEGTKRKMSEARKKYYEDKKNRERQSKTMKGNQNARKQTLTMIGVDYEEFKPETYNGVIVYEDKVLKCFKSECFEDDLARAIEFAEDRGNSVAHSSSLDNYISDSTTEPVSTATRK